MFFRKGKESIFCQESQQNFMAPEWGCEEMNKKRSILYLKSKLCMAEKWKENHILYFR